MFQPLVNDIIIATSDLFYINKKICVISLASHLERSKSSVLPAFYNVKSDHLEALNSNVKWEKITVTKWHIKDNYSNSTYMNIWKRKE